MKLDVLLRAAQILRAQPSYTMPLVKLHTRLRAELGSHAGTYAEIYLDLKKRPQSFLLVDSPRVLHGSENWPRAVREAYNRELEGAGLGALVRVTLTEVARAESDDALALASTTLNDLWSSADKDPLLRDILSRASAQLDEISALLVPGVVTERPTTRSPDPQPES